DHTSLHLHHYALYDPHAQHPLHHHHPHPAAHHHDHVLLHHHHHPHHHYDPAPHPPDHLHHHDHDSAADHHDLLHHDLHLDHDEHHHEHSGADHYNHPGANHHDHADHDHHDAHVRNDDQLDAACGVRHPHGKPQLVEYQGECLSAVHQRHPAADGLARGAIPQSPRQPPQRAQLPVA